MMAKDYVQEYINAVESGQILVGDKIQKAIDRHKRDLERSKNDPDFPYVYDIKKAQMPVKFISMLPDPQTGKPNKLAKFQKFLIAELFGWVHKDNGFRRFNKAYISMARKQGRQTCLG